MTKLLLGDGVEQDPRDARIEDLEDEVTNLRSALSRANVETVRAREDAGRALGALRRQLSPLYRALQAVFGELDAAGVDEPAAGGPVGPGTGNPRTAAVWEAWKQKLPPACGKVIDALLTHSELNQAQIKVAARLGTSTVSDVVYKLNKAGLINKAGGRVSLKSL